MPKGKGGKAKKGAAKGGGDANKDAGGDDDWESALAEFQDDAPAAKADAAADEPPPAEGAAEAADSGGGAEPPEAPAEGGGAAADGAAAFLAQMGLSGGGGDGGESAKDKKKKDKKKGKGKPKKDKEAEPEKQTAAGKLVAARLQAQAEEQRKLEEAAAAEEARIAEEERKAAEEAQRIVDEKKRKADAKKEKIAQQKKDGTYQTKAQKEKAKLAAQRLEQMKAAGMIGGGSAADGEDKPKKGKVVYGNKKKKQQQQQPKKEEPKEEESAPAAEKEEVAAPAPAAEEAPKAAAAAGAAAPAAAAAAEDEESDGGDWDADDWDADDALGGLAPAALPPAGRGDAEEEEEEDAAIKEARLEKERLAAAAEARKKREGEAKAAKAAKDALREKNAAASGGKGKKGKKGSPAKGANGPAAEEDGGGADGEEGGGGGGMMSAIEETPKAELTKEELKALELKLEARDVRKAKEEEGEALRSTEVLRSPIVCIMGHVDTGKTKLLDKIRRTNVQDGEAGGITQQIGATYFPGETLHSKTDKLNKLIRMQLKLPGMLVIDTPGHEAFSNLRNRGSSLCDIAILVIDLMHGLEQQTIESIEMLRKKKCPFVVALNKVDRCYDWTEYSDLEFRESLAKQGPAPQEEFRSRMQKVRTQLMERGMNAELYWENKELANTVSLVPTSAITGEGVNDLLHMLARLSQMHLAEKLSYSPNLQCTVLEVKVIDGLGCTVDVILVNGEMENGCTICVCTTDGPVVTQVRALLTPPPNRELRIKSQYVHNDKIKAAIGIKICAPGLENAVAGSPVMVLPPGYDQAMLDDVKDEVMADFKTLAGALATDKEGVLACASTLGALEALLVFLREECDPPIPVSAVSIGPIFKKEVMRAALMHEKKKPEYATILAFDVDVDPDAREAAVAGKVTIFTADIIYHLFDQFTTHRLKTLEEEKEKAKDIAVFPCLVKIMPNMVFNQKDPIICGVTVEEGILKVGTPLCIPKNGFIQVGRVTSIENNHQQVEKMGKGSQCAIQIVNEGNPGMTYGRQFNADHALYSELSRESIDALKKYFKDEMSTENWKLVVKLKKVFSII